MKAQTILKQAQVSVSIGICATSELENTTLLTELILGLGNSQVNLSEIVVATPNRQLAASLDGRDPRLVVVLEVNREGKARALNRIFRRASGEIIVLASADIKIARNTIPKLVNALATHHEWGAVDSQVELINGDKLLMDRITNLLWDVHNATLNDLDTDHRLGHVAGDLLAIRRGLIDQIPDVINDDAYIALTIQEKGFRVKRVQDSRVWIAGPRTPTDYIYQRSRILRGHLQLISLFGKMPSTFEFQVLWRPRKYLALFVKAVGRLGPSHLLPMFVSIFLELISFQVALLSTLTRQPQIAWRIVRTTKQI